MKQENRLKSLNHLALTTLSNIFAIFIILAVFMFIPGNMALEAIIGSIMVMVMVFNFIYKAQKISK